MKAAITVFLLLFLVLNPELSQAQEVDPITKNLTNIKIDSLLKEAVSSIEKLEYQNSIARLRDAHDLAKTIDNKKRMGLTSSNLSKLYILIGDLEKATQENSRAIEEQNAIDDPLGLGQSYVISGQLLIKKKDYQKAATTLQKAASIFKEERSSPLLATALYYQSIVANDNIRHQEALTLINDASKIFEDNKDQHQQAKAYTQKAKILVDLKRIDEAKSFLDQATEISQANNYETLKIEGLKIASDIAIAKGDYQNGYEKLERYNRFNSDKAVAQGAQ